MGYLPSDLNRPRAMTGADAIAYFGSLRGDRGTTDASVLVDRFGRDPGRPVRGLSTGNRRKVGLVIAFMGHPELLILDEPTSGLDPVLQEEFRELLSERKAGSASIWLTSHVMAEVERVADRVGLVRDGVLVRELSMDEPRRQAGSRMRLTVPETVPHVSDIAATPGSVLITLSGSATELLRRAAELGTTAPETERRDLDEIFLEMFDDGARP